MLILLVEKCDSWRSVPAEDPAKGSDEILEVAQNICMCCRRSGEVGSLGEQCVQHRLISQMIDYAQGDEYRFVARCPRSTHSPDDGEGMVEKLRPPISRFERQDRSMGIYDRISTTTRSYQSDAHQRSSKIVDVFLWNETLCLRSAS